MILESYDKFEYKILPRMILTGSTTENKLNDLGDKGWELIYVTNESLILKRKITVTKV